MTEWCSGCGVSGVQHANGCPLELGDVQECVCVPISCRVCGGRVGRLNKVRQAWFTSALELLNRINKLLRLLLEKEDREYLEDFVDRLVTGNPERMVDRATLRELERKYVKKP